MFGVVVAALLVVQAPAQEARPAVDPELRELALRALVEDADIPKLVALYDSEKNTEHRELILRELGDRDTAEAQKKLADIASRETDKELQETALRLLAEQGDTPAVIAMYDAQKDPELKEVILRELGDRSEAAAQQKLVSIMRGDSDPELREAAARAVAEEASTKTLIELFDSIPNRDVREIFVRELGERDDDLARQKLMSIIEGK
jgi:HEAT repeats